MTLRFHLWSLAFATCSALNLPFSWSLRCVRGMSDATEWTPGEKCGEGEPF